MLIFYYEAMIELQRGEKRDFFLQVNGIKWKWHNFFSVSLSLSCSFRSLEMEKYNFFFTKNIRTNSIGVIGLYSSGEFIFIVIRIPFSTNQFCTFLAFDYFIKRDFLWKWNRTRSINKLNSWEKEIHDFFWYPNTQKSKWESEKFIKTATGLNLLLIKCKQNVKHNELRR